MSPLCSIKSHAMEAALHSFMYLGISDKRSSCDEQRAAVCSCSMVPWKRRGRRAEPIAAVLRPLSSTGAPPGGFKTAPDAARCGAMGGLWPVADGEHASAASLGKGRWSAAAVFSLPALICNQRTSFTRVEFYT